MDSRYVKILDVPFIKKCLDEMLSLIIQRVEKKQKAFIVTANPEIVMYARKNEEYMHQIRSADFIVADGCGILIGSRMLNNPLPERITGYDLMMGLLEAANINGWSIYLLGGSESVNGLASEKITKLYPNIKLAGRHHGYFDWQKDDISMDIIHLKPDLIFVAMGCPLQEKWITKNYGAFSKGIFLGVGGSFDVIAGKVNRAPLIWQDMYLEWLYRLLREPARLSRMKAIPSFVVSVIKAKIQHNEM